MLCWHPNGEALQDQPQDPRSSLGSRWGDLLIGKRPLVTARLEPCPSVEAFVTIIPFPISVTLQASIERATHSQSKTRLPVRRRI